MKQSITERNQDREREGHALESSSFWGTLAQLPEQYVKVIAWPSVEALRREAAKARWSIVGIQFLILVALTIALNSLGHLIPNAVLHTIAGFEFNSFSLFQWLPAPFNGIALILATFLIGLGTAYPFSRLFKGQGRLVEHAYVLLLFTIPLVLISGALLLIPAVGTRIYIVVAAVCLLFLYRMVLHVMTIIAVHDLSIKGAMLIVLIIPILLLIIAMIVFMEGKGIEGFEIPDLGSTKGRVKKKEASV